jgi:hypothetical protein
VLFDRRASRLRIRFRDLGPREGGVTVGTKLADEVAERHARAAGEIKAEILADDLIDAVDPLLISCRLQLRTRHQVANGGGVGVEP